MPCNYPAYSGLPRGQDGPSVARGWSRLAKYVCYAYNLWVERTFGPEKNTANLRKHGVSLTEGDGVLNDPLALSDEDLSAAQQRFVSIGLNVFGQLRVVVYTYRGTGVRIISVRKPEPKEVRTYEERI